MTRDRIAALGLGLFMTAGVADLPLDVKARVLIQVQTFAEFNADTGALLAG